MLLSSENERDERFNGLCESSEDLMPQAYLLFPNFYKLFLTSRRTTHSFSIWWNAWRYNTKIYYIHYNTKYLSMWNVKFHEQISHKVCKIWSCEEAKRWRAFFFGKLDTTSLPKQKNGKEINAGISTKLYLMQLLEIEG